MQFAVEKPGGKTPLGARVCASDQSAPSGRAAACHLRLASMADAGVASLQERRMHLRRQIARRLAAERFSEEAAREAIRARTAAAARDPTAGESLEALFARRRMHSVQLVADAADDHVYTVELEQRRAFSVALEKAMPRIENVCELWCDAARGDEVALLRAALVEMESCLGRGFGGHDCDLYIGLLQPKGDELRYVVASQRSRMVGETLRRGEGVSFRCIDNGSIVMVRDADSTSAARVKFFGKRVLPFVCVPLTSANDGSRLGVLAVDGFNLAAPLLASPLLTGAPCAKPADDHDMEEDAEALQSYTDRLEPFLAGRDKACQRVKLWRPPGARAGSCVKEPPSSTVAARAVAGHVCAVDRQKGQAALYTVQWEDGLREGDISLRLIREMLMVQPLGLGIGTPLDEAVVRFMTRAAQIMGDHLDRLRSAVRLERLAAITKQPAATAVDAYRVAMSAVIESVMLCKIAEVRLARSHSRFAGPLGPGRDTLQTPRPPLFVGLTGWRHARSPRERCRGAHIQVWELRSDGMIDVVARLDHTANFRSLRAPRRLLEIPGKHRYKFWDLIDARRSFVMPFASEIVVAPFDDASVGRCVGTVSLGAPEGTVYALVATRVPGTTWERDVSLMEELVREMMTALTCIRGREARATTANLLARGRRPNGTPSVSSQRAPLTGRSDAL